MTLHVVLYCHSLVSDWNHGNAHFLRGIVRELISRGCRVTVFEPENGWSRSNLVAERGAAAVSRFASDFPELSSRLYDPATHCPEEVLGPGDLVIVHEWTDPEVVSRIGRARRTGRFTLLFHDTHHRAVSSHQDIASLDLSDYDGVLAFGETLRQKYLEAGWGKAVHTWHEAADTRLFRPLDEPNRDGDLVWIGNWGDGERSAELHRYLVEPVRELGLTATVHGVRYPAVALEALSSAGITYRGWVANADVPRVFARHRLTIHVPRRPYVEALPGIPTIRVFEALACGIPLVSAPWRDEENLFRPGTDFLFAGDGEEMRRLVSAVIADRDLARSLAEAGLDTIRTRHTCRHRVDELFAILAELERPVHGTLSAPKEVTA